MDADRTPSLIEDDARDPGEDPPETELLDTLRKIHELALGQGAATDYIERRMAAIEALTKPYA